MYNFFLYHWQATYPALHCAGYTSDCTLTNLSLKIYSLSTPHISTNLTKLLADGDNFLHHGFYITQMLEFLHQRSLITSYLITQMKFHTLTRS